MGISFDQLSHTTIISVLKQFMKIIATCFIANKWIQMYVKLYLFP